jgi:hypothetical protein
MANEQLESFLGKVTETDAGQSAPAPAPEPTGESKSDPKAAPDAAKPEDTDDDGAPPAPLEGEAAVPLRALEATRRQRNDYKEAAARAEGELKALREQLAAAKAAPPPQPAPHPAYQPPPQPTVSFAEDPEGYLAQERAQRIEDMMHERANFSEMRLRDKIGSDQVDAMKAEFKKAAEADPTLYVKLRSQLDPYSWANAEVERIRLLRDVGTDPAAYRAKIEAEVRAKLEEEMAAVQPTPQPASPIINQPRSLANVRSVAARAAPAFTGDPSITEILAQRKF